jgi:hypothetical protein
MTSALWGAPGRTPAQTPSDKVVRTRGLTQVPSTPASDAPTAHLDPHGDAGQLAANDVLWTQSNQCWRFAAAPVIAEVLPRLGHGELCRS